MARIDSFVSGTLQRMSLHDPIDATYFTYELDGRKLLQINTSGRKNREMPDKVSQSIQLDEDSAGQLFTILKNHFGFK
ncbi:methionyl-tRNA formyltransferase [Mesorhizobium sp. B2-3-5]|uniref:methionyl-tRNA formyltransferase n=1 Tax=Mesorhizobium sp. B2-3-5 TaxID=2589958 RepID=UPI00112D6439|nr:methionyl-tRNA formyltransferase [Mesorhizobium sp. B2-3-5]TPM36605.1 methionyl-tRNA formyltransferase [Mesorhizobium sp. B2-3-5]